MMPMLKNLIGISLPSGTKSLLKFTLYQAFELALGDHHKSRITIDWMKRIVVELLDVIA